MMYRFQILHIIINERMTVSVVLTKLSTLHCLTLFHAAISVKVVLPLLIALFIEKEHVLQMGSLT